MNADSVILASKSSSRRALLSAAGVQAKCIASNVDEENVKTSMRGDGTSVRDQAMALAELKATKVSQINPGLVIGGDQMLNLDGVAFDKPVDSREARDHLAALSGRVHYLETAIVVCEKGNPVWRFLARPKLTVRVLTKKFIEEYVESEGDSILQTVGCYRLEGLGAQLFSSIEGDYFSILGLPLLQLLEYLRERGVLET